MQKTIFIKGKARARLLDRIKGLDYKDVNLLKVFIDMYGRIVPRRYSGLSLSRQKELARAIKRSRIMGLLPFVK